MFQSSTTGRSPKATSFIQQDTARTFLLVLALLAVAGGVASLLVGWWGLLLSAALLLLASTLEVNGELALRFQGGKRLDPYMAPELHELTAQLARAAGVAKPHLYRLPGSAANALATESADGRGAVGVTRGLLEQLSPPEVEAVLAHEISHLKNNDTRLSRTTGVLARATTTLVKAAAWVAFFLAVFSGQGWQTWLLLLAAAVVVPVSLRVVQTALSRTREFAADATAAKLTGRPLALASALTKLERQRTRFWNAVLPQPRIPDWLSTHPPTPERIERLRAMSADPSARRELQTLRLRMSAETNRPHQELTLPRDRHSRAPQVVRVRLSPRPPGWPRRGSLAASWSQRRSPAPSVLGGPWVRQHH